MPTHNEVVAALRTALSMVNVSAEGLDGELYALAHRAAVGRPVPRHRVLELDGGTSWVLTFYGHRSIQPVESGFQITDDDVTLAYVPAGQAWRLRRLCFGEGPLDERPEPLPAGEVTP